MRYFALILDNMIRNVAVGESMPEPEAVGTWMDITDIDPMPGIYWSYIDGKFSAPPPPKLVKSMPGISIRNSMEPAEYAALVTAANTDPEMKSWLAKLNAPNAIFDGYDPDVRTWFSIPYNKGLLTKDRSENIFNLNTPVPPQ